MTTPKLKLPHIVTGQTQKEVSYNGAMNVLDALVMPRVADRDLTTPPGSPTNGTLYIPATSSTGAWSGQDGKLALYYDGWSFITPLNGMSVYVIDENCWLDYMGSSWQSPNNNAVQRSAHDANTRPTLQVGGGTASLFVGDGSATFVNSTAYIGFNAARTASNTWTYQGDGTRNGGAVIDGRMDGAVRFFIRATASGSTTTETDSTTANNERLQVQRSLISMGGPLGTESFRVVSVSNMVNRVEVVGGATGTAAIVRANGTDTNVDLNIAPRGAGYFSLSLDTGLLVTTVGAAGGASSLPATPLGYMRVKLNGTVRKIPYYND